MDFVCLVWYGIWIGLYINVYVRRCRYEEFRLEKSVFKVIVIYEFHQNKNAKKNICIDVVVRIASTF